MFFIVLVLVTISYYVIKNSNQNTPEIENKVEFSLDTCPIKLKTEKYYGTYFETMRDHEYKSNYTLQDYKESLEYDLTNYGFTTISSSIDYLRQGIRFQRFECYTNNFTGANINYIYCGGSPIGKVTYSTTQEVDNNGIIQQQRYYEIKFIIDKRQCTVTEPKIDDSYGGWISGINFECTMNELGCKEIEEQDRIICDYDYYDCEDLSSCTEVLEILGDCGIDDVHHLYENGASIPCKELCGYKEI